MMPTTRFLQTCLVPMSLTLPGSEDDVKSAVEEMVYTEMLTTAIAEKENIAVSDDELHRLRQLRL